MTSTWEVDFLEQPLDCACGGAGAFDILGYNGDGLGDVEEYIILERNSQNMGAELLKGVNIIFISPLLLQYNFFFPMLSYIDYLTNVDIFAYKTSISSLLHAHSSMSYDHQPQMVMWVKLSKIFNTSTTMHWNDNIFESLGRCNLAQLLLLISKLNSQDFFHSFVPR